MAGGGMINNQFLDKSAAGTATSTGASGQHGVGTRSVIMAHASTGGGGSGGEIENVLLQPVNRDRYPRPDFKQWEAYRAPIIPMVSGNLYYLYYKLLLNYYSIYIYIYVYMYICFIYYHIC
jgi:hypothetical protein